MPARALPGTGGTGGLLPGISGETTGGGDTLLPTGELPAGNPGGGGNAGAGSTAPTHGAASSASATDGTPAGLTSFARPRGGYQTRPRYPDAARRDGVEGEVLLRFQVLGDGHVGAVTVTRSAGRDDFDRAAVEAVKTWLFEPARRGKEPVTVWVTLPVRFQLGSGKD
jgi:protein TonB